MGWGRGLGGYRSLVGGAMIWEGVGVERPKTVSLKGNKDRSIGV